MSTQRERDVDQSIRELHGGEVRPGKIPNARLRPGLDSLQKCLCGPSLSGGLIEDCEHCPRDAARFFTCDLPEIVDDNGDVVIAGTPNAVLTHDVLCIWESDSLSRSCDGAVDPYR